MFSISAILLTVSCSTVDHSDNSDVIAYRKNLKLQLIDVDSGEVTTIADSVLNRFSWSPDGRQIAFVSYSKDWGLQSRQIYLLDLASRKRRAVTLWDAHGPIEEHPNGGSEPIWSPDGEKLLFTQCDNCEAGGENYELYISRIDTSSGVSTTRVTNNLSFDRCEDWDTASGRILFISTLTLSGEYDAYADVYTILPDGSDKQIWMESDPQASLVWCPRYSPDGTKIAFISRKNQGTAEIYIRDIQSGQITQLTDNDLSEVTLSWAYDSQRLTFMAGDWMDGGHIYIFNLETGKTRKLTSGSPVYYSPAWRPPQS